MSNIIAKINLVTDYISNHRVYKTYDYQEVILLKKDFFDELTTQELEKLRICISEVLNDPYSIESEKLYNFFFQRSKELQERATELSGAVKYLDIQLHIVPNEHLLNTVEKELEKRTNKGMSNNSIVNRIMLEKEKQKENSVLFDKSNTINDWIAHVLAYLGRATTAKRNNGFGDKVTLLIKAAALIITTIEEIEKKR